MRVVVVGAGILGLAAARAILESDPASEVLVVDKEREPGRHQTGHNSGVVHAGLYYKPGSLKARFCRRGVALLRDYCREKGLAYEECGKVLVAASDAERRRLDELMERSEANGVPGVRLLTETDLRQLEPHVRGLGGLHSPTTAIVDFRAVARAFADDVARAGGEIRLCSAVASVDDSGDPAAVRFVDGTTAAADRVLVCAGLHADRIARASGRSADPRIIPFRGEYFALRPDRQHLVKGLIYPVPDPSLPFLGVHLTRSIDGSVLVGPNAVLALAREGYTRRALKPRDVADIVTWPGMGRVASRYWKVGVGEIARSMSKRMFVRAARRYVPELGPSDVVRAAAGVRAQAVTAAGALADDFILDSTRNVVWVRNAPSPAATSSMAIAEELVERLELTRTL
jgi:L-2-hydroxyglutarate oxidase LhgO